MHPLQAGVQAKDFFRDYKDFITNGFVNIWKVYETAVTDACTSIPGVDGDLAGDYYTIFDCKRYNKNKPKRPETLMKL